MLQLLPELLLIAGDLYDGDWKDYSTGLFLIRQLARLREGDVQVALMAVAERGRAR